MKHCKCFLNMFPIPKIEDALPTLCMSLTLFSKSQFVSNILCLKNATSISANINDVAKKCYQYIDDKCNVTSYNIDFHKDLYVELSGGIHKKGLKGLRNLYSKIYPNDRKNEDFINIMRDNVIQIVFSRKRKFGDFHNEEYSYNFSQLLSDVGGLMGLWLGMSVVGLFEIMQFFYFSMKKLCKCQRQQTKSSTNIESV